MSERLEVQAKRLDDLVRELEKTVAHAKVAAAHFRSQEVPRACAHTMAVTGHLVVADTLLKEIAVDHRLAAKEA
jgi:hypothetical protein